MTIRPALAAFVVAAISVFAAGLAVAQAPARTIRIVTFERENDPFYEPVRISDGVARVQNFRPFAGAELGIRDSVAPGRAVNATFQLERRSLAPEADIGAETARAEADGVSAILLDLPTPDIVAAAKASSATHLPLFNIRDRSDALRREFCGTSLFHVIPSQAALTDALAQFVVRRNWRRVLALVGPEDADRDLAHSFERSAKKFGARIVDTKPFVVGNDPRNREQTSIALMTSDSDFDVVFL